MGKGMGQPLKFGRKEETDPSLEPAEKNACLLTSSLEPSEAPFRLLTSRTVKINMYCFKSLSLW